MKSEEHTLLFRSFDDELFPEEEQMLKQLLDRSPEARTALRQHQAVRRLVAEEGAGVFAPGFSDHVMQRVATNVVSPSYVPQAERSVSQVTFLWRWVGVAAVLLVGLGVFGWYHPRSVTVAYGEQQSLTLPDGSLVELSSGTTLTYQRFWVSKRRVQLAGEAFFDVVKGTQPFVVETFNAEVIVTGTRFNVRAWPQEDMPETAVSLQEGQVAVAALTMPQTMVYLEPGQTSRVSDDAIVAPSTVVSMEPILVWRTGGIAFSDAPLTEVFRALERRFNIAVTADTPTIAHRRVTYLDPHPTSGLTVLSDICFTLNLHYRKTANGYEVIQP